jgi:hypothetical protein
LVGSHPADDENDVEEVSTGGSGPRVFNMPLQGLVLDTRSVDVGHIGQWYFVSQMPENDLRYFCSAEHHRVKALWEMACVSQPMYSVMEAFALHKKAVFCKQSTTQYYEQKGRVIQDIVANFNRNRVATRDAPDPLTVVAVAILGFLDIRDSQFDAAGTHLRAVCKFIDMPQLPPHAWIYRVWIDLRFALFTGPEPQLPIYIPRIRIRPETDGS